MVDTFFDKYKGSLDSKYTIPSGSLASTTNPQTANQLAEATKMLNAGVLGVDISNISPEIFQSIPKEHFSEIGRLTKLTGAEVDLHAPVQEMDPAGFGREGWSEQTRQEIERQFVDVLEKGHLLDPKGNVPVNFHASGGVPGRTWRKIEEKDLKNLADRNEAEAIRRNNMRVEDTMDIVNQDTGKIQSLRYDTRKGYGGKDEIWTPKVRQESMNHIEWDRGNLQLFSLQKEKTEVENMKGRQEYDLIEISNKVEKKEKLSDQEEEQFNDGMSKINSLQSHINEINSNIGMQLIDINDKMKKYAPKPADEKEQEAKERFDQYTKGIAKIKDEQRDLFRNRGRYKHEELVEKDRQLNEAERKFQDGIVSTLSSLPIPEVWRSTDDFSKDKAALTVANASLEAYKKFGNNTPLTVVENIFPEWTLSRADELKETVEKSRNIFAENLSKEKNISKEEAKKVASKFIGVTWDVGHINMLRKQGFSEEEIVAEAKKIAPLVKQVHITDNFGFNDVHLPAGMGNVPLGPQLKELQKKGFKIEKGKLVHEGGGWWQHFKTDPVIEAMGNLDSPLYTVSAEPSWYHMRDTEGVYRYGFGDMLPDMHFKDLYGGGFSNLPKELGGQVGGDRSRFTGAPNE